MPPKIHSQRVRRKKRNRGGDRLAEWRILRHCRKIPIVEMDPEGLAIKQEIKEEDEVCFELISVKEESLLNETEQVENCLEIVDSQSCFVADGIKEENELKEEPLVDTELNESFEFEEKEISCDWFEPPLNEPDPLALTETQDTSEAPYSEVAQSSSSSNSNGTSSFTEKNCGDKKYKSDHSSSISSNESIGLKHHMITHIEEKPFKCEECDYSCNQLSTLKYHKMTHTWEQPFSCSECNYSCNQLSSLKYHMVTKSHMMTQTEVMPFKCTIYDQLNNLQSHRSTLNKEMFKCTICKYSTNHSSNLKVHRLTHPHTKENPLQCCICDYYSNRLLNLRSDKWTRINGNHKCTICNYSTNHLGHFKRHILTHNTEKLVNCNTCDYSSYRLQNLQIHKLTHIKEQHKCTNCNYSSNVLSNFNSHILTRHAKEKPFKCKTCDYSSYRLQSLQIHKLTHIKEQHKCTICNYSTNYLEHFKIHILTHNTEKLVKCNTCDSSSYRLQNLQIHKLTHIKKQHKCTNCNYVTLTVTKQLKQLPVRKPHVGKAIL